MGSDSAMEWFRADPYGKCRFLFGGLNLEANRIVGGSCVNSDVAEGGVGGHVWRLGKAQRL